MYNVERKQQFLSEYNHRVSSSYTESIFNKMALYEEQWNKDACDFIQSEITTSLRAYGATAVETLRYRTSIIRTYTNWCIVHQYSLDNINHYDEINTEVLKQCVNRYAVEQKYITPLRLKECANELVNACDKFLLYAFYEGIRGDRYEEITNLTREDINQIDHTIKLPDGRNLEVSPELIKYAVEAADEDFYYSNQGLETFNAPLVQSNLVFKPRANVSVENVDARYRRIIKRMIKIKTDLEASDITIPHLYNSGIVTDMCAVATTLSCSPMDLIGKIEFAKIRDKWRLGDRPSFQLRSMFKEYFE